MAGEVTTLEAQQDALRPIRMFVGGLTGVLMGYDQTYAGADGTSWNTPYRYQSVGPYGVAVEGAPISTTPGGGLYVSPMLVMLALGAAAVMVWKR
ncbi:hypothetical protein AVHY2522_22910 [Acidovorax sp. SUPP2522]|uniref:hypothetical protein n=1 Tax=unclassified Acidovorax TaxID=2684926 RepID=UPI0023491E3E|nr:MULTISPECIES: hypothetical protein [unclassified Acidovorax]WCM95722.1 hypothetical protein M5C96_14665 [Acidovorax sp. GBBC 1281]GKT19556.1 hypothetical protein AVHY2522_22910 [Acidovorax sp. SUPP2522]